MCCCKKHLHARWSVQALIECASLQNIDISPIENYSTFFQYLTADCNSEATTYLSWECSVDSNHTCRDIETKWSDLQKKVIQYDDHQTTVNMQHFEMIEETTKYGKTTKRLKAVSTKAGMEFITNFISKLLSKIIHHRNQLKHYRTCIKIFNENFDTLSIDVDFSENLSIPVKSEPQSLHWSHEQVTIHSGIMKLQGEKSYHPYISNDKKHDQHFVHVALQEMLKKVSTLPEDCYIVIESDNCASQYKSSSHFSSMQSLANEQNRPVIRVFGIAEHGKGEVDHVGGIAKTTIRREIAAGKFFANAESMVSFLQDKFKKKESPRYIVKEIDEKELNIARSNSKLNMYKAIEGSSKF